MADATAGVAGLLVEATATVVVVVATATATAIRALGAVAGNVSDLAALKCCVSRRK